MGDVSKRAKQARMMRDKGLTYEDIGEILGVSRQRAHQLVTEYPDGFHEESARKVKYVGLRNWLLENRMNMAELERKTGLTRLHKTLKGDCEPRKSTIDAILAVTGLTYEECFRVEEGSAS